MKRRRGVGTVVEGPTAVEGVEHPASGPRMSLCSREYGGAEQHPGRREDGGNVRDRRGFAREWSGQTVDHEVRRRGFERSIDGQRLADVGLDGRDVKVPQATCGMQRSGERHRDAIGKAGSAEEVAGARTNVQVPLADMLSVPLDQDGRRTAPDESGSQAEHHGVVDVEERPRVVALASIRGVVAILGRDVLSRGCRRWMPKHAMAVADWSSMGDRPFRQEALADAD